MGARSPKVPLVPQMPFFPPFARWGYGKSRPSSYTNSKQLRVCRLLGADLFCFRLLLGAGEAHDVARVCRRGNLPVPLRFGRQDEFSVMTDGR
jgi:hypothetical protein